MDAQAGFNIAIIFTLVAMWGWSFFLMRSHFHMMKAFDAHRRWIKLHDEREEIMAELAVRRRQDDE